METDATQITTALLTEHLQYTPLSLIDDIIDSVNNLIYQGVGSLEAGLFATPPERLGFKAAPNSENGQSAEPDFPEAKKEIEEGLHKLETLLNSTIDKNFDKFEIYVLRNILNVPDVLAKWVRLKHYEGMQHPLPLDAPTTDSVHLLRQRLNASRQVNRSLERECRRNDTILDQLRDMTGPQAKDDLAINLAFLSNITSTNSLSQQSQQPLTTTSTFTMSQLPALKSTLADLKAKLATLGDGSITSETAKDELREDRRQYIEQRTQSVLERSGQSIGNDPLVGSRKIEPSDITALEKAAGMFQST